LSTVELVQPVETADAQEAAAGSAMAEDNWGKSAGGDLFEAPPPPSGVVPQSTYKDGSASQLNMALASEWLHRDSQVASHLGR
jgi:hypothetical protein